MEIPEEDRWAYEPEHRAIVTKARTDIQGGAVQQLSDNDLAELARAVDDDA